MTDQKTNLKEYLYETSKNTNKILLIPLSFKLDQLEPVISKQNVDLHYNVHSKKYVQNANSQHDAFNIAGAVLHNLWWEQLQPPSDDNKPDGKIAEVITKKYKTFSEFKKQVSDHFMAIQGSGWVAVLKSGSIITISNHQVVDNVIFVIDGWEHAWYPTYQADKKKYIENIWKCINWQVVNSRL